jgi:hypothetical protein
VVEKKSRKVSSLSFRLVRNLSAEQPPKSPFVKRDSEGFPTSGNDNCDTNESLNPGAELFHHFCLALDCDYGFNR